MLQADYPDYFHHKAEHVKLAEKALTLAKDFNEDRVVRSLALLNLLKEWTQRHILSSDKRYSVYLRAADIADVPAARLEPPPAAPSPVLGMIPPPMGMPPSCIPCKASSMAASGN
jgi:hypothetical protein